jgi:hypothetical protein
MNATHLRSSELCVQFEAERVQTRLRGEDGGDGWCRRIGVTLRTNVAGKRRCWTRMRIKKETSRIDGKVGGLAALLEWKRAC